MTSLVVLSIALVPATAAACKLFAEWMRSRSIGQHIRSWGPKAHVAKAGVPTMGGGVLVALWSVGVAAIWPWDHGDGNVGFVLAAGVLFGGIGLLDDLRSIRRRRSTGITPLEKIGLASAAAVILYFAFPGIVSPVLLLPFTTITVPVPPPVVGLLTWFVFLATTNSVNLTDGLDGLAGGVVVLILCGIIAVVPDRATVTTALPMIGGLLGFLWLNAHPATLILGDVGAFALGGIVGALVLVRGLALVLPILAGVIVLEAGSVLLQIPTYRITGVRLFKMSPLHHHFESTGSEPQRHLLPGFDWPEAKVTVRFWILQAAFTALGVWAARGF